MLIAGQTHERRDDREGAVRDIYKRATVSHAQIEQSPQDPTMKVYGSRQYLRHLNLLLPTRDYRNHERIPRNTSRPCPSYITSHCSKRLSQLPLLRAFCEEQATLGHAHLVTSRPGAYSLTVTGNTDKTTTTDSGLTLGLQGRAGPCVNPPLGPEAGLGEVTYCPP